MFVIIMFCNESERFRTTEEASYCTGTGFMNMVYCRICVYRVCVRARVPGASMRGAAVRERTFHVVRQLPLSSRQTHINNIIQYKHGI